MKPSPPGAIRPAGPRDLDRVSALFADLVSHHGPLDPLFRLRAGSDDRIRGLLDRQLRDADAALFVCEMEGELVGFCSVRRLRAPPIFEERERAEISDLAVRESSRRRGVGRALAEKALRWASEQGLGRAEVRVAAGNPEGQGFWRALGFDDLMDVLQRRL